MKIKLVAKFLAVLKSSREVSHAVRLMLGRPLKDSQLNLGYNRLLRVLMEITCKREKEFLAEFNQTGDLGETVKRLLEAHPSFHQQSMILGSPTISQVAEALQNIAEISGKGAMAKKDRVLESYLRRLSPLEAKYFAKNLVGEMRHGFSEGLMEEALASAFQASLETVRTAHMILGDLGRVGEILKTKGARDLQKFTIKPFTPIKPMLAESIQTLKEALKEHNGNTLLEFKLDGARVQIHRQGLQTKIFSRRLTEVTKSLPEIAKLAGEFKGEDFVMDGEVVAVDGSGKILPFQAVMRRYRRIIGVEEILLKIPTKIFLFDILYLDRVPLLKRPLTERRLVLEKVVPEEHLIPQVKVSSLEEAENFFSKALESSCEGVMAKRPSSVYSPGRRGKHWLKIKRPPEVLDLVIVAAEYGYGYRYRWLSDYYLAALDGETLMKAGEPSSLPDYIEAVHGGRFRIVGKTFKGLTNAEIEAITKKLKNLAIETLGRAVIVKPEIVVEVGFSDIQPSPQYSCGYALRFARILRIRDDKKPDEADSLERLKQLYKKTSNFLEAYK